MVKDVGVLSPYKDELVPLLQGCVSDPTPTVRTVAARALGNLVGTMGEESFPGLVDWLVGQMQDKDSAPTRSGGARALVEVLVACDLREAHRRGVAVGALASSGQGKVANVLGRVLPLCRHAKEHAREGLMWLLLYLGPASGPAVFAFYLPTVLPIVLSGLADDVEAIRELSMRAGQVIVSQHSREHTEALLLPLMRALLHTNWRIRKSSVLLLGDMLSGFQLAAGAGPRVIGDGDGGAAKKKKNKYAVEVKDEAEERRKARVALREKRERKKKKKLRREAEKAGKKAAAAIAAAAGINESKGGDGDDNDADRVVNQDDDAEDKATTALRTALGDDRYEEVMASIYLVRSDESAVVRQAAATAWKGAVRNTPRTLRGVLPRLVEIILRMLSSADGDRRKLAGRCLGDVVKKLGERVLPVVIPLLKSKLGTGETFDEFSASPAGEAAGSPAGEAADGEKTTLAPAPIRQGVAMGLREVAEGCSARQLQDFMGDLLPCVYSVLVDESDAVRAAAAGAFIALTRRGGEAVSEAVIPRLLAALESGGEAGAGVRAAEDDEDEAEDEDEDEGVTKDYAERVTSSLCALLRLSSQLMVFLVPRLTVLPMTAARASLLAAACESTRSTLHLNVRKVVSPLLYTVAAAGVEAAGRLDELGAVRPGPGVSFSDAAPGDDEAGAEVLAAVKECASRIFLAADDDATEILCSLLVEMLEKGAAEGAEQFAVQASTRTAAAWALGEFFAGTSADFDDAHFSLLRGLINRFFDPDATARSAAVDALAAMVRAVTAEELCQYADMVRVLLSSELSRLKYRTIKERKAEGLPESEANQGCVLLCIVVWDLALSFLSPSTHSPALPNEKNKKRPWYVPAFTEKAGAKGLVQIYLAGVTGGSVQERQECANALRELLGCAQPKPALKPLTSKIAGALIRVMGDRFPSQVKAAVLDAVGALLRSCGSLLKGFLPPLQTTFSKALQDASEIVRDRALAAFQDLLPLVARADPLVKDLLAGITTAFAVEAEEAGGAGAGGGVADATGKRLTLTVALRDTVAVCGRSKRGLSSKVRKSIRAAALDLLLGDEDAGTEAKAIDETVRAAAAGVYGEESCLLWMRMW